MDKDIILCGDLHGNWDPLFSAIDVRDIRDVTMIGVGDMGVGFAGHRPLENVNAEFQDRRIDFMTIRGNHDDPEPFRQNFKLSNLELLPDYTTREFNGETFLFVGGGVSLDRTERVDGVDWWHDEGFVYRPEQIGDWQCDVLVTHVPPTWNGLSKPGLHGWAKVDETLVDDCKSEKSDCDELIKKCGARTHYCGHFHQSSKMMGPGGVLSTLIDINEIILHGEFR